VSDASEIIKSGAIDKLADIVHKLAGPLSEEVGLLMADKIKVYRVKNWVAVVKKTNKVLAKAKLPPQAVPPRIFLPILEGSSLESDESLQDMWAGLLATASYESDSLSPSFIETVKQLTPNEARTLSAIFEFAATQPDFQLGAHPERISTHTDSATIRLHVEGLERQGIIRRKYALVGRESGFFGRKDPWSVFGEETEDSRLPKLEHEWEFTQYGVRFMNACRGPKPNSPTQRRQAS
jgi:hypothetical protein